MSTGVYLRFATNARSVTVSWVLRPACAEKWFAGCHLYHMPDSGTSAMDTYAYDPVAKEWRHSPNGLLHYAEHGTQTIFRPDPPNVTAPALSTTFLLYVQRIDGRMETTRRCCRIRSMTHHYAVVFVLYLKRERKVDTAGGCPHPTPPYFWRKG